MSAGSTHYKGEPSTENLERRRNALVLPDETLKDQVAIVTGGGTGLGFGIARELGRLGARLALVSRNPDHVHPAALKLEQEDITAKGFPTDIRQADQVAEMVAAVKEQFGRIDILINAAAGNFIVDSDKLSVNGFNAVVASVLHGSFYCTRAAGLEMIQSGRGGRIVNVVASYAWTGGPRTLHSAVAKAGVVTMTRTLAVEWAHHHIRVNALCPGPTDTEGARAALWADAESEAKVLSTVPAGRLASIEEIANAAAYLVSPYADFVNGEVFVIDGGQWLGKGLVP